MFKHVFAVQSGHHNCYALLLSVFALKCMDACDSVYASTSHLVWVCVDVCVCVCLIRLNTYVGRRHVMLIHKCDMSHPHVWHDSFLRVTWLIRMRDMTHSHVYKNSILHVTSSIHTCDMTLSHSWHDSILRVTWLFHAHTLVLKTHVWQVLYLYPQNSPTSPQKSPVSPQMSYSVAGSVAETLSSVAVMYSSSLLQWFMARTPATTHTACNTNNFDTVPKFAKHSMFPKKNPTSPQKSPASLQKGPISKNNSSWHFPNGRSLCKRARNIRKRIFPDCYVSSQCLPKSPIFPQKSPMSNNDYLGILPMPDISAKEHHIPAKDS